MQAGGGHRRKHVESARVEPEASERGHKNHGRAIDRGDANRSRPLLEDEELPVDVQDLIASFSSEPLFVKNAVRIIEGIRAEATANSHKTNR